LKILKDLSDIRSFLLRLFLEKQHWTYCIENLLKMLKNRFYIDSCIFLGILIKDENTRACKSFISRVNNSVYKGFISPFVTGEMINSILYDNEIKAEFKPAMLHTIVDMLISARVENFVQAKYQMNIYVELRESDNRISESDMMHVVCAKILDIPLVTTDSMLINSRGLKKHVDIFNPADIL